MCEVEYIVASNAVKKMAWLKKFIDELGVIFSLDGPFLLYCDSTDAIAQAKKFKSHQKTKHILCHYLFICKIMDGGDVNLQKINEKKI